MKTTLCVMGSVLALAFAAPALAQDAADTDTSILGVLGATRTEAPAQPARIASVSARAATESQQPESLPHRLLHIDRFWVVGSFR